VTAQAYDAATEGGGGVMAITRPPLDAEYVRRILDYDPCTGLLRWKRRDDIGSWGWNTRCAGKIAGCIHRNGYRVITIHGRQYPAAQLAWLHYYGKWPLSDLMYVNDDRDDARVANLHPFNRTVWHVKGINPKLADYLLSLVEAA
jgi:hypothetical protein